MMSFACADEELGQSGAVEPFRRRCEQLSKMPLSDDIRRDL